MRNKGIKGRVILIGLGNRGIGIQGRWILLIVQLN
jgi:hypothetical protein